MGHVQCKTVTRMWAQRHSRPAECRWGPLLNAAKFGWRPLLERCAVMLPRRETCLTLLGCPKLPNRSQPLVGRSSPYCEDMWRTYCRRGRPASRRLCVKWSSPQKGHSPLLNKFFSRLSIRALVAKIQPDKVVRWCADVIFCLIFASCMSREPRAAHFRPAF